MPFWVAVCSCSSQGVCILCTVQNDKSWEKSSSNFRQMLNDASVNHKAKYEGQNLSGSVKTWGNWLMSQEGIFVKYNYYWSFLISFVIFSSFKFVTGAECCIQDQWLSLFSGLDSGIRLLYKYKVTLQNLVFLVLFYHTCCVIINSTYSKSNLSVELPLLVTNSKHHFLIFP